MRLGAGLCLSTPDSRQWQLVVAGEDSTGVAVRLDDEETRVGLGLAFLDGQKVVDVSVDPASWVGCARDGALAIHQPRGRWANALATGLLRTGEERGWWGQLPEQLDPEVMATAAAWPLLRPAIWAGANERVVPRWAAPLCAAKDVASGTHAVLGARANRRVVREMASALSGPVRWWPIACGTAVVQLDGGRVGDLLVNSDATYRCTQDEWVLLGTALRTAPPDTARRLISSANGPDGPQRLLRALDGWQRIKSQQRLIPNRLDHLEALVLAELEVPPPPRPVAQRPRVARRERRQHPRRQRPEAPELIEAPLPHPVRRQRQRQQPARVVPENRIHYADRWQHLHQLRRGQVELVLPVNGDEVTRWARTLNNCLNLYRDRVERQQVVIVGVRYGGELVGAVEINPGLGLIGQMEGGHNRALPAPIGNEVLDLLTERGLRLRQ